MGGKAAIYIEPTDTQTLAAVFQLCTREQFPFLLLGDGANILFSDKGFQGLVLCTKQLKALEAPNSSPCLVAECGAAISDAAAFTAERGLTGMEFIYAMPGSVGGAIYMNARCYDKEIADVLTAVDVVTAAGTQHIPVQKGLFGYKTSPFQDNQTLITRGYFRVAPGNTPQIWETMLTHKKDREAKGHFQFPCAGSVFKNNRAFGKPTGAILDSIGLKGYTIGEAAVSKQHANIFVNKGQARAADMLALIRLAQNRAKAAYGFKLELEIILAGDW